MLLALIGTILVTAMLVWDLIFNVMNVLRGWVPAVMLFSALIYAFGAFLFRVPQSAVVMLDHCGRALESVREARQGTA